MYVVGNGGSTDSYVWTQTLSDLEVSVLVPVGTRGRELDVQITNTKLKVGLKGQPPIIDVKAVTHLYYTHTHTCNHTHLHAHVTKNKAKEYDI